jgi:hypothetical protein
MSELYGKCPAQVDLCLPQGQTWETLRASLARGWGAMAEAAE